MSVSVKIKNLCVPVEAVKALSWAIPLAREMLIEQLREVPIEILDSSHGRQEFEHLNTLRALLDALRAAGGGYET